MPSVELDARDPVVGLGVVLLVAVLTVQTLFGGCPACADDGGAESGGAESGRADCGRAVRGRVVSARDRPAPRREPRWRGEETCAS